MASVALAVPSVYAATAGDADDAAQVASASVDDGQDAAGDVETADAGNAVAADSTETDAVNVDETIRYQATAKISDGNDVAVNVDVPAGALPDDVTLEASSIGDQDNVASALDGAGVDYDGFVALDVRFVDANGNEVEPSAAVNVLFDVPQAALGDVDASSVTVQHFVEDAQGNVAKVETVADAGDTVDGTVTVDDAQAMSTDADVKSSDGAVRAEFTVDSFSTFTISYNNQNTLTVHLVDSNGVELPGGTVDFGDLSDKYNPTDFEDKYIADMWVSMADLASTWASKTEGYTYQRAYINSSNKPDVQWIRYNKTGYTARGWCYSSNNRAPADTNNSGTAWPTTGGYLPRRWYDLYLVYMPVASTPQTGDLAIADDVAQSGKLTPQYTGNGDVDHYVWSQSTNGVVWETITRLKMNGDEYNLNENGSEFNVVLNVVNDTADTGGRYYQVTAYDESNRALAVSPAFQLPYYDELRNGDFEAPKVDDMTGHNNKGNYQYPTGTTDLIWNTTGSDQQVEIIDGTNSSSKSDYKNQDGAQNGIQYAELNAQASGALYQDVMTVPGTDLNWRFSHRGRNGSDTMYLVIAPTETVADITTQEQLMQFIQGVQQNPDQHPGCYVISKVDGSQSWATYSSSDSGNSAYEVPEGQYLTRFFFVAGHTASGNDTVGNLLDNVYFTTGLLPARPGTASLSITKTVSGVDSIDDLTGYKVSIALGEGSNESCNLAEFHTQGNGTFVATCSIEGITVPVNQSSVNVTVTETVQDDAWTASGDYVATGSTVSINGGNPSSGIKGSITLTEGETGVVAFTNSYKKNSVTIPGLKETKTVEGRDAEAGEFLFTVETSDDENDGKDDAARLAGFGGDYTDSNTHSYTFVNQAVNDGETDTFRSSSNGTAEGLKFTSSDVGTYTYVYKETTPGNGWHQVSSVDGEDVTAWKVVIRVIDTDGLQAVVTVYKGDGTDNGWKETEMGGTYTTNSPEDVNPITLTFKNTYTAVSALPLTGGDSTARTLLLSGGGVLLVAGAAWLLARRRRV